MHAYKRGLDISRDLRFDEGREASESLELRGQDVEEWRGEDVLALDVGYLRLARIVLDMLSVICQSDRSVTLH